jgi:secreted trypsin-like serine protease
VAALWLAIAVASPSRADATFECVDGNGRPQTKIVGGHDAPDGAWPWQVYLQIAGDYCAEQPKAGLCGGSLIHPQWVLTAAHCLVSANRLREPSQIEVVHGTNRRCSGGVRTQATKLFVHPDYSEKTWRGDVGLVRLDREIVADRTSLVTLQSEKLERAFGRPGTCAMATGFGLTDWRDPGSAATRLQQVDVPIVPLGKCEVFYMRELDGLVCAGYWSGTKDSCRGDSGGPLVVPGGPTGWTQVGVVSRGRRDCATGPSLTLYARVSQYLGWIQRTVSENR